MDNHHPASGPGGAPAAVVGGADALPARCPIRTRIAAPECRFHPRLLRELIQDGDLNETDGCPLRRVCQVEGGNDFER
jgi:hypothetical protein